MGRRLDVDQLVDAADIAERLNVSRPQVVHVWRDRYDDFPQPVFQRRRLLVWYWPEIRAWARETGRLPKT